MGFCSLLVILAPRLSSQEVEGNGNGGGALFSACRLPGSLDPLTGRVGTNIYSFYLGNLQSDIALLEVPTKLWSHLAVRPSYLFIKVPANGLALLTKEPQNSGYRENQFRLSATLSASRASLQFRRKKHVCAAFYTDRRGRSLSQQGIRRAGGLGWDLPSHPVYVG